MEPETLIAIAALGSFFAALFSAFVAWQSHRSDIRRQRIAELYASVEQVDRGVHPSAALLVDVWNDGLGEALDVKVTAHLAVGENDTRVVPVRFFDDAETFALPSGSMLRGIFNLGEVEHPLEEQRPGIVIRWSEYDAPGMIACFMRLFTGRPNTRRRVRMLRPKIAPPHRVMQ